MSDKPTDYGWCNQGGGFAKDFGNDNNHAYNPPTVEQDIAAAKAAYQQWFNLYHEIRNENAALKEKLQFTQNMLKQCQETRMVTGDNADKIEVENDILKEKLKVAIDCLRKYSDAGSWVPLDTFEKTYCPWSMAKKALAKIGEM